MKKVIIIGAGGHAAEIDEYIQFANQAASSEGWEVVGFLDDNPDSFKRYAFSAPFLGGIGEHKVLSDVEYIMGIANLAYRGPIIEMFVAAGARFATLIHPGTYVSKSAVIGQGVVIAPNVNIGPNVKIGDFTLLNARCSIGHDSELGRYNFICPNVSLSGFTKVGDENLFGVNSATIPGIQVGSKNKIAAGMVLDKDIADDAVVFFRQKERVMAIPKGSAT
ncbi:acetyltransferase [Imperialibacter roseus]|uniref:Acetyltransferase n=1 Tax=Imperialibacter roseus TaxID=1324217 RepID=A0ABZ0IL10_9BACT|nr:acetyltransferase [Imperialibacter roseus]WOK05356.1 acetyltransferase [Imperialibacter roseus]